ncbi:MAG TPA: hypothetical protein VE713_15050 [Pyrinomonadaceae bacterium]|nr:hypothetical protein [Pyrinomonadaceae bacterium]
MKQTLNPGMTEPDPEVPRLLRVVDWAHLVYLGALPSLATFSLLYAYGHAAPLLLFLGGTVAVGVYLAAIFSYTPPPRTLAAGLLQLLDGPAWALLSIAIKDARPLAFAVEGFLVDGTATWVSLLVLAARSPLPTRDQRRAAIAFMLAALAASLWLAWPYLRDAARGRWGGAGLFLLGLGVLQDAFTRYRLFSRDQVLRPADASVAYLVPLILAWVASMILGNVLHELGHSTTLVR